MFCSPHQAILLYGSEKVHYWAAAEGLKKKSYTYMKSGILHFIEREYSVVSSA